MKTKTVTSLIAVFMLTAKIGYSQEKKVDVVLGDYFEDSVEVFKNWPTPERALPGSVRIRLNDDEYEMEHFQADPTYIGRLIPEVKMGKNDKFIIETNIKYITGDRDEPFGVFFADRNNKIVYCALISGNGSSQMVPNPNNYPSKKINSQFNREANVVNYLKVEIMNGSFFLYVNGEFCELATVDPNIDWPITHAGFVMQGNVTISSNIFRCSKEITIPTKGKAHYSIGTLQLMADNKHLISRYANEYFVWDVETAHKVDSSTIDSSPIGFITSPDAKYYLIKEGVYKKKSEFFVIKDVKTDKEITKQIFKEKCTQPMIIDNKTVVVQDIKNSSVNYYDITSGTLTKSSKLKEKEIVLELMVDLQHGFFVANDKLKYIDIDKDAVLYDVPIPQNYSSTYFKASNDGQMLYASNKNELKTYLTSTGTGVKSKVFESISTIGKFNISPDKKFLLGYDDKNITVIDLDEFTVIKNYTMSIKINSLTIDGDFQYAYVGLDNGEIHKMDIATGETVLMFGNRK